MMHTSNRPPNWEIMSPERPSHLEAIDHMNSKLTHYNTYSNLSILIDRLLSTDFGLFVKINLT